MTDGPQGPGWWQAADLKWYPPEQRPGPAVLPPPPAASATPAPEQPREPAKARQVIGRDKLGVLSKIGQGGQGVVYRAPNVTTKFASSMVYKEYKTQTRTDIDFTALAAMPALVEDSLTYSQAERLISIAAWPCAIVDDAGAPTGFVMPAIPEAFFVPLTTAKGVSTSSAEFQHLLNHPTVLAARGITVVDAQRFSLLRETASALAFLHKHGVCVGDISPKNLLFSLTPREAVYFIDCDAMRINGVSALPQVQTPGWDAPAGEELATIYSDTYKLGLLALRMLAGDQDTKSPGHLPATTPAQLRQIITDTLTNDPNRRPLPEAWTYVLGNAIEEAQHQQKTAAPVAAPLAAPEIPVVRARPVADSAPPVRPSAPPVPQPRPVERPLTEIGTPPSTPISSKASAWAGAAAAALVVAVLVAGAVGLAKHNNIASSNTPQTSSTTATPTTTTTTPIGPPPVAEAALDRLLLSSDQINTAMGVTGITIEAHWNPTGMLDNTSHVADKNCLPLFGAATLTAYKDTGTIGVRDQELTDYYRNITQAVALFSSAQDAGAFFTASAQRWPSCSKFVVTFPGIPNNVYTVGPISNANGTLSVSLTTGSGGSCQRALTTVNNVVVDVRECTEGTTTQAGSAVNIASQIAAKVPT
jgi:serine/threonine protein kinase